MKMMPSAGRRCPLFIAGLEVIVAMSVGCASRPPAEKTSTIGDAPKQGWIKMIGIAEAEGQLKENLRRDEG